MTNNGAASAFTTWEQSAPTAHDGGGNSVKHQPKAVSQVGEGRLSHAEREEAIRRAGEAMEGAYRLFAETGKAEDLDRAYRHLQQMRELVAGRPPEVVAAMEQERGLA